MTRRDYKRKAEENPPYPPPREKLVLRSKSVERKPQAAKLLVAATKNLQQQLSAKRLCPLEPHVQLIKLQLPLKENHLHNLIQAKPPRQPVNIIQRHAPRPHPYQTNLSRQLQAALRQLPSQPQPRTKCLTIGPELLTCSDREIILRMPLALVK